MSVTAEKITINTANWMKRGVEVLAPAMETLLVAGILQIAFIQVSYFLTLVLQPTCRLYSDDASPLGLLFYPPGTTSDRNVILF